MRGRCGASTAAPPGAAASPTCSPSRCPSPTGGWWATCTCVRRRRDAGCRAARRTGAAGAGAARRSRRNCSAWPCTARCMSWATTIPTARGGPARPCGGARSATCAACSQRERADDRARRGCRGRHGARARERGDAPPVAGRARVPLHRALHVGRLALLVVAAAAAGQALSWWMRPWAGALATWGVAIGFVFVVGDALPRSLAQVAPDLAATALPLARRSLAPFRPLLWLLGWVDQGLHALVAPRPPLAPDLGAAQRDMLLGVFTLADTTVDEVMTPRLDMVAVDVASS